MKHTAGPWEVNGGIRGYAFAVIKVTVLEGPLAGQHLAVADVPDVAQPEEAVANAWLIAAAPDLLAALKAFWMHARTQGWLLESHAVAVMDDAAAAINKAEGT